MVSGPVSRTVREIVEEYVRICQKFGELPQRLNDNHFKFLSEIAKDISQILLASTVVPYFTGLDKIAPFLVISGLGGTLAFWTLGMVLVSKIKDG